MTVRKHANEMMRSKTMHNIHMTNIDVGFYVSRIYASHIWGDYWREYFSNKQCEEDKNEESKN